MPLPTMRPYTLLLAAALLLGAWACTAPESLDIASEDNTVYAAPGDSSVQAVVSLVVVDAQTDEVVLALTPNTMLSLSTLPAQMALRAATSPPQVGSVRFDLDGNINYCTQNAAPYVLGGTGASPPVWATRSGGHTITVTPFSEADLQGTAGRALTIPFSVADNDSGNGNSLTSSQNSNTQNANTQNANLIYNPNLPIVHIYDFANGVADATPLVAGRVNGVLVAATLANDTLVTTSSPSLVGMRLPSQVFAHYNSSFTIEQWLTWAQVTADYESIFSIAVDTDHFVMAHPKRSDNGLFSVDLCPGNGTQYSATAPALPAGSQVFMAVIYDAQAGTMSLYLNGTYASSVTLPVAVDLSALAGATYTGVGGFSAWSDPGFNGNTRRFIVQPQALSAQQVAADYANPARAGMTTP